MEKRKSKASNSYRDKASDYYLDCSCSLRVHKEKGNRKQQHRTASPHHQYSR